MLKKILERPVLATVISILLVILGTLAIVKLPMETFPEIAPPSVVVTARYPGASAEAIARSVATPLEQVINGVENMIYMTSSSSNDGTLNITVYFKLGTNPDQAAINVQNRVTQATSQLPQEVLRTGITTTKQNNSMVMVVDFVSKDSTKYDSKFLNNYDLINVIPGIERIPGVGQASVFGSKSYAMRVWLNPDKLATYGMTPAEVMKAIDDQNLEAAPGRLGEGSPVPFEYTILYKGKLKEESEYENIVIRGNNDGSVLRLKDVARIELGSLDQEYAVTQRVNRHPGIGVAIFQTPGSNANDVQIAVLKYLKKIKPSLPKGIEYIIAFNTKNFLDTAIEQVKHTFVEVFILVFIVIFVFLQDFRSTLIPAIAVPVSIIGTFFFMDVFGFSINLLTLFALVLAIGIVVDDAVVVVEAVHSKLKHGASDVKKATIGAMSEITGAIVSITVVMAAVFLPIGMIEGPVGVFYRQFAFTLAIAISLSAINALTLSPVLCAIFLKNKHEEGQTEKTNKGIKRFYELFNIGFHATTKKYSNAVRFLIHRKWVAIGGLVVICISSYIMITRTPQAFIPTEDQGIITTAFKMPPGTSLSRTKAAVKSLESLIDYTPVYHSSVVAGSNVLSNNISPSYAAIYTLLKQPKDRGKVKDINVIMDSVRRRVNALPEGNSFTFAAPTVPGFGAVDALEVVLKDNTNGEIKKFASVGDDFKAALLKRKEIGSVFTTFDANFPQYMLDIDNVKVKQLGLEVSDVLQTIQAYYGSVYSSDFIRFGKYYRVVVQADAPYRADENSLNNIFVKNSFGKMVPVKSLAQLKPVFGPEVVTHLNQATSINYNVQAKQGYSSGDAMDAINEVAAQLPIGYSHEYVGISKEANDAGNQNLFVFALCIVFVYFLLAAQYESYVLPFAIVLSLPVGVFGVFAFINLVGVTNNIYVQIALIMLIGLLAKNAILIVEFALQRRHAGKTLIEAAMEGAALRLRPILMTSFAFIAGLLPLFFAGGATEQGNRSIASGAIGGMFFGVALGIFIIPVLFVIFQSLHERIFGIKQVVVEHTTE